MKNTRLKRLLIIPVILIGVAVFMILVKNSAKPVRMVVAEKVTAVRVISVLEATVAPQLKATGNVKPSRVWSGVAQVSGKIISLHSRLKQGALIAEGEVLLQIDPRDYQLAKILANARAKEAEQLLATERGRARQAKREWRNLGNADANDLFLRKPQLASAEAQVAAAKADLAKADLNLERTTILMPFNGRIAEVKVELQQFVAQGSLMVVADGISKAEIAVQIPMEQWGNLIHSEAIINLEEMKDIELGKQLGLSARVLFKQNQYLIEWDAKVARLSDALDPRTRTVGVIIEVDKPYAQVQPGRRPPLVKGLFVDVILKGRQQENRLVVPLIALHGQQVYVVNQEQRLEQRKVTIGSKGVDYAIIVSGLQAGEQVVISGLISAVEGMLLKPTADEVTLKQLLSSIQG